MAVSIAMTVSVLTYDLVDFWTFTGVTCCLHFQGRRLIRLKNIPQKCGTVKYCTQKSLIMTTLSRWLAQRPRVSPSFSIQYSGRSEISVFFGHSY